MKNSTVQEIAKEVNKLGSFFAFFKKKKLTDTIYTSLSTLDTQVETIPLLLQDLEDNKKEQDELNNQLNKLAVQKEKLEHQFEEYKQGSLDTLASKNEKIKQIENKLQELKKKYLLVSKLLSAKSSNSGLLEYKNALYSDFMNFANKEDSLANEAEAILTLQEIEQKLKLIAAYPNLHKKNTIAIGGSFSAGKSEFISSFFKGTMKLPISIEPTTAIPAYVMNSEQENIIGCSFNGGVIDLKQISSQFYSQISHDFIKSFEFNLKDFMPYMVFCTQFDFENICFIDTPGYNPAQT